MEMNSTNHSGWFSRPGAVDAGLVEKTIRHHGDILAARPFLQSRKALTPRQEAALEAASGDSGFSYQIRVIPAPTQPAANRYGKRLSLGVTRSFASAEEQRKEWVQLIVAAAKASNRR